MSIHCFTIPALHPEPAQGELNTSLAQQCAAPAGRQAFQVAHP